MGEVNAQDRSSGICPQDRSWASGQELGLRTGVGPQDRSWEELGGVSLQERGTGVGRGKPSGKGGGGGGVNHQDRSWEGRAVNPQDRSGEELGGVNPQDRSWEGRS